MEKYTAKITSKSIEQSGLPSDYRKVIAEYIWNGFDANASKIEINYDANETGYINDFSISDNGSGVDITSINDTFGNFLDSQKSNSYSNTGFIKGKKGKGRYSFTSICNKAIWRTIFNNKKGFIGYDIQIDKSDSHNYRIDNQRLLKDVETGTEVFFAGFFGLTSDLLESIDFQEFIASEFGWFLFLNKEKDYKILVNGVEVNYMSIIDDSENFNVEIGESHFKVSYLRWSKKIGDKYYYYFLNQEKLEVSRKHTSFNNKAIDFHHSLYVESTYFNSFKPTNQNSPILGLSKEKNQTDAIFKTLIKQLHKYVEDKEKHFIRDNKAEKLIEKYHKNKVFPSFGNSKYNQYRRDDLENVVKELYCVQPKIFENLKTQQSKTIVGFLNLLLDTSQRENVLSIVEDVVNLTEDERKELASTLKNTKLQHITTLVKFLENRFNVVSVLRTLIYDLEKFTTERDHIQKIIENNYWLFGEQYHMVSADKNFEILLNNYYKFLEENGLKSKVKPLYINKKNKLKRPDIFVCRQLDTPDPKSNESLIENNIIVELKRPSVVIGDEQFRQVEGYLRFIIEEERFNSQYRKWKFVIIGKKVDNYIKDLYENQENKGKPFLVQSIRNFEIYAMTWDDVFKSFELKHKHLINKLDFKDSILEELEEKGVSLDVTASDLLTQEII
jgi:hypothetical protein